MTTHLILLIALLISFLLFMICQSMVPGMNLLSVIESRNRQPGIYSITARNLYAVLITSVPVMLSLYVDYFFSTYRIPYTKDKTAVLFTITFSTLSIWIGLQSARKMLKYWGERIPVRLNFFSVYLYLASRILFIVSYELYFRGFIFWYCLQFLNLAGAITVNLVFYLIAHYRCNQQILLGCIPMGILLCLSNYIAYSILPAILIHLCLTIPYEYALGKKTIAHPKYYAI